MVTGAQLLGLLSIIGLLFYGYLQYRKRNISKRAFLFWNTLFLLTATLFITPSTYYPVMEALDIDRTADFVLSTGVMLSLAGLFVLHLRVTRINNRLEELVEKLALENKE